MEKSNKPNLGTISVSNAARMLSLSRWTVVRMLEDGTLEGCQLRKRGWRRVKYESVLKLRKDAGV
jgi:excisionase family DNA binding protein